MVLEDCTRRNSKKEMQVRAGSSYHPLQLWGSERMQLTLSRDVGAHTELGPKQLWGRGGSAHPVGAGT